MEIDPRYCDVICRRFIEFSGKPTILEATGETFAAVGTSRSQALDGAERPRTAV